MRSGSSSKRFRRAVAELSRIIRVRTEARQSQSVSHERVWSRPAFATEAPAPRPGPTGAADLGLDHQQPADRHARGYGPGLRPRGAALVARRGDVAGGRAVRAGRSLGRRGRRRTFWSLAIRRGRSGGRSFPAGRRDVPAALQAACRAAIVDSRPRGESPDAAEQELLKRLAGERPVAEEHGQWRLYQWGEAIRC